MKIVNWHYFEHKKYHSTTFDAVDETIVRPIQAIKNGKINDDIEKRCHANLELFHHISTHIAHPNLSPHQTSV